MTGRIPFNEYGTSTAHTGDGIGEVYPQVVDGMRERYRRLIDEQRTYINNMYGRMATTECVIKLKETPVKNWKKRIEQG